MSLVRPVLFAVSLLLIGWGLAQLFAGPGTRGELRVVVENAGLPLAPDQYTLELRRQPGGELLASGTPESVTQGLPPGDYSVTLDVPGVYPPLGAHAGPLHVTAGERTDALFRVEFGELSVTASLAAPPGTDQRPNEPVLVQVFGDNQRTEPVIAGVAGTALRLAAGTYDVRIVRTRATREVQIQWLEQVVVEPGRREERAVTFGFGTLIIGASAGGRTLQPDETRATVFAAGDASGRVMDSGAAGTPMQLASGTWDIELSLPGVAGQPIRWLRGVHISERNVTSAAVEFAVGTLTTHVSAGAGTPVATHDAYVHVYRPDDHRAPLGYAPAGLPIALPAGRYDVRVELFRSADQPDHWLRDVQVADGESVAQHVLFDAGMLVVRVFDERGAEYVGDEFSIGVHAPDSRRAALAHLQAGVPERLSAGRYDLAVTSTYSGATHWLKARVKGGATTALEHVEPRPAAR